MTAPPIVGGIVSPGHAPSVITVGALKAQGTPERSDDIMADFSSRGPTSFDGLLKPDLVAPGHKIVSAEAPGSYLARTYPEIHVSGRGKHGYFELSGTSMSAAVTSGSVALLVQANPTLTPAQVKLALQLSASPIPGAGLVEAGAGSLNVLLALHTAVAGPRRGAVCGDDRRRGRLARRDRLWEAGAFGVTGWCGAMLSSGEIVLVEGKGAHLGERTDLGECTDLGQHTGKSLRRGRWGGVNGGQRAYLGERPDLG